MATRRSDGAKMMRYTGKSLRIENTSKDVSLLSLENGTKAQRLELWADGDPVPPWEWMH